MDRERVSLSLKATQEDPWQIFARTHAIGQVAPGKVTKLVTFGAFVRVDEGIEGLVHISELAERHVEIPEQVVQVNDDVMVKIIDIDLERRRISLSLKQANETAAAADVEEFDPTLYGMTATYDEQGNYIYPEGFDPETGEWLEGYDEQRAAWEEQYAKAHARWEAHVKQQAEAKIIELDKNRNNVVLSRRAWLEQTQSEVRQTFLTTLQKGQVRSGVVSSIVNFGAFVDLGGVDGLVHVSELSWKHIDHPSEVVEVGQEVTVEVLDVDMDRERVSLSLKATQEDPWQQFARTHQIGQVVPGKVTKLVPFGAFVRVDEGIEGLVHISELAERHVEIPEQVVQVNDEIFVKVIDIDLERRRISLSLKQANEAFGADPSAVEFDPTLYGMAASYDDQGNYIYPEGFDPETNDWLEGYEKQREEWERQYAEAQARFEQHQAQVIKSREADAQAAAEGGEPAAPAASGGGSYSSEGGDQSGALASDEALAALREKLAGGQS